jgi:hypothetical protein
MFEIYWNLFDNFEAFPIISVLTAQDKLLRFFLLWDQQHVRCASWANSARSQSASTSTLLWSFLRGSTWWQHRHFCFRSEIRRTALNNN